MHSGVVAFPSRIMVGNHAVRPAGIIVSSGYLIYLGIPDKGKVMVCSILYITVEDISSHCTGA